MKNGRILRKVLFISAVLLATMACNMFVLGPTPTPTTTPTNTLRPGPVPGSWEAMIAFVLPSGTNVVRLSFTVAQSGDQISDWSMFDFATSSISFGQTIPIADNSFELKNDEYVGNTSVTRDIKGTFTSPDSVEGTYDFSYGGFGSASGKWNGNPSNAKSTPSANETAISPTVFQPTAIKQPTMAASSGVQPSPTVIPLPDVVNQTVAGASIKFQDTFDTSPAGSSPQGWISCNNDTQWGFQGGALSINTNSANGTSYYYAGEPIDPKEGVYLRFQYTGTQGTIAFGFDNYQNGPPCNAYKKNGYYSVAMELDGSSLSAHSINSAVQNNSNFTGNLSLQENNWYGMVLGYDENNSYFITIWKGTNSNSTLVFHNTYKNFPKTYYFIGYMISMQSLKIDNFTIFTFDRIQ